ncbi:MAG: NCS2 family permease [Verrucomicrobia bacterium]|nr:NCS2 family permease [Verrucomicrobiota bacterium]
MSVTKPAFRFLDSRFGVTEAGSTLRRELAAGVTTFMTMAYIVFLNPLILSGAGMPKEPVVAMTCLGAIVPTLLMGLWANYPLALASGMGLNAAVVVGATQPGMDWQTMMGVIVVEGGLVTLLVLSGVREHVMNAIPLNLKRAIGVGIGLFIAFLGLQNMGWVARGDGGALLTHGSFTAKAALVSAGGLVLLMALLAWRVRGAILIGIAGAALLAAAADLVFKEDVRLFLPPAAVFSKPDFSLLGEAKILAALKPALFGVIFAFLITDFFDTMGTVIGIGGQGGFLDAHGRLPRLNRVLLVDSIGAIWGGLCGCSSVTTYIESAAGVSAGGRTGLTAVVVAAGFLLAMFLAPIVSAVPAVATAPALVVVGFLMMAVVKEMDVISADDGLPAFLTLLVIPLTQSIATGIGVGFISLVLVRVCTGRARQVSPWLYGIAALFAASFIWGQR